MKKKIIENIQYVVLALLILGQVTIGTYYILGQCFYLIANIISVTRCFLLKRPKADKFKDITCTGITLALIITNLIK